MPGKLNQYEVRQTLGSGFSCKVKLGVDTNSGRKVALKIIKSDASQEVLGLVQTECEAMQAIEHHENVIAQYEATEGEYIKESKNGQPGKSKMVQFIVLELATGGEIFDFVAVSGAFKEEQARYFFKQFMNGLLHCHNKGVAHRDLKPENLLLDKNYNIKIADFGFAGPISGRDGSGYLNTPLGTPAYMAPELLKQQQYQGAAVDIFAAAAILFILVAQHPPFNQADSSKDPFYKMLAANRADLFWKTHCKNKKNKDGYFSEEFKDLIQSMLQFEPSHRPSFSEILEHPWMKLDTPTDKQIRSEFEKRHMEVKANQDQEKQQREMERQKNMNQNKENANYRGHEKSRFEGQAPLKQIKPIKIDEIEGFEQAVKTLFVIDAHPDEIEEVLLTHIREQEKVEAVISDTKYKTIFKLNSMDQGGLSQETEICVKLFKVDDQNTAIEFQNMGGSQYRFYEHFNNYKKNVLNDF